MSFKIFVTHEIELSFNTDMKIDYENMGNGIKVAFISGLDGKETIGTYKNT